MSTTKEEENLSNICTWWVGGDSIGQLTQKDTVKTVVV